MNTATANVLAQVTALTEDEQKEIAQVIAGPEGKTRNALWLIVVIAFAIVLVGSFGAIAYGMFRAPAAGAIAKPELVISMFTSVVGFLAGLFAPSPVAKS